MESSINFAGKRITVMGLGTFGGQIAAIEFLADEGASQIIVTDVKPADQLAESLAQISRLPNVTLHLGGHREADFAGVDAVVVSPAVPRNSPLLALARRASIPLTSEMNLFFALCPAPIVAVTGSAGKSTTTAMIYAVLAAGAKVNPKLGTVHLGGNIGHRPLLTGVRKIPPTDTVVLELSSFQLEGLGELGRSPRVAVVTNIAPNHLDRHGTMAEYVRCKQNILRFQRPGDLAVLNGEDPALADWAPLTKGAVRWFRAADLAGWTLRVVGVHNRSNAAAALAVGQLLDVPDATIAEALAGFAALPHRLELVGQVAQVRYFNDSKSTTPESTLTALAAFESERTSVVLIVGGYDKKIDLEPLCLQLAARAKAVVAIGQVRNTVAGLIRKHRPGPGQPDIVQLADCLADAVRLAARLAGPGDAVVLSPACASYDQFTNYEDRGQQFRDLVKQLA